jgi:hemoglobin/transferrin/lactoferrin receptor protein
MGFIDRRNAHGLSRPRSILPAALSAALAGGTGLIAAAEWGGKAFAQTTTAPLPPVTVEGATKAKKKSAAQKAAPKATPTPATPPPAPVDTPASRERAQQDAPYQTPAAVSTATKSDLDTFGQLDTGDVLRSMPGTYTRESANNPGLAVNIRGLEGSGRVNMMIDGVRQNFRFTGHEAQGFVYVDPALLAGIDVARGVVSTAGGAGALVGAANFRTIGVEDILKPGRNYGVLSTVSWGSNQVGWQEMGAAAARVGPVAVAGAISHREPDNYKNGDGITVPYTRQNLTSGLAKLDVTFAPGHTLKFGAVLYENDFLANSYDQTVKSNTYTMKYAFHPTGHPLIDFRFNLSANQVEMEYFQDFNPSNGIGSAAGRVIKDDGIGFDVSNTSRFKLGPVKVKAVYGYEAFKDDVDSFNKLNPAAGGGVNPSGEATIGGAFWETTFTHGIVDLIAALRYDTYKLDGTFFPAAGNPWGLTPGVAYSLDQEDGRVNPKVTLGVQLLPWLQPYVSYGEAFRAPTIFEAMAGGSHPGGGIGFLPNPFLRPEIQEGWEFGFNVKHNGVLVPGDLFRLKVGHYEMDVENYITACFFPTGVAFCNATGKSHLDGWEVEGMYDARQVFVGLAYTYANSDLPSQVNGFGAQSYLPDHVLVVTGGVRLLHEKLTLGARGTITSEAFIGVINNPAKPYTDGYQLLDLYAKYRVHDGLELGANLTNVFDAAYSPALSTPVSGPNANIQSGRGRTVLFTARTQF